ncbi:MAG TPA: HDOD domain-containing protein [Polyangiaceae bacterium]|nr:HDOD domain-containing protein [Polyangiaceae bacterium]
MNDVVPNEMFDEMTANVIGRRVGNYVIERALARGGMGSVFLARHPALGREAAVKFLGDELDATPEFTERFLAEARITAGMRHRNIVDIFDFGELDGRLYYVMELLKGWDLSVLLRGRGRFTCTEMLDTVDQICRGLAAAHAIGVVHRDLKPGNVFITQIYPMQLKLMDFGVAKVLSTRGDHTRHGQVIGTPRYMAPEQALGEIERIGPRSDIYSLGTMAYEMLAGTTPFDHALPVMLLVMQVRDPVPPLDSRVPNVPPEIARLLHACLEKEPQNRPASVSEILSEIDRIRRSIGMREQDVLAREEFVASFCSGGCARSGADEPRPNLDLEPPSTQLRPGGGARTSLPVKQVLEALSQPCPRPEEEEGIAERFDLSQIGRRVEDLLPLERTLAAARAAQEVEATRGSPSPSLRALGYDATAPAVNVDVAQLALRVELTLPGGLAQPESGHTPRECGETKRTETETASVEPERTPKEGSDAEGTGAECVDSNPALAHPVYEVPVLDLLTHRTHPEEGARPGEGVPIRLSDADRVVMNRLLMRMQRQRDFPAFVQHVNEVNKRADCESSYSAQQLGSSILKDYALTAKLLRIVNSTYANRFGGKIYSVQHAIVILGFDRIRAMAISTSLLRSKGDPVYAERITESAINSAVSGEIARQLHQLAGIDDPDQAMACAMFRNLGKHLVLVYLPEKFDEILALSERERMGLNQASERVLGISLQKLGIGVAQRWNLPTRIVAAMSAVPKRTDKPVRDADKLASLADLSTRLCDAVSRADSADACSAELSQLLSEYKHQIPLEKAELDELLEAAQRSVESRYATLFGMAARSSRYARTLASRRASEQVVNPASGVGGVANLRTESVGQNLHCKALSSREGAQGVGYPALPVVEGDGVCGASPKPKRVMRLELGRRIESTENHGAANEEADWRLLEAARITALNEFVDRSGVERVVQKLLAALAQYLGGQRVLILRATSNRRELYPVVGIGEDLEGLMRTFRLPLGPARAPADPISMAYHLGRDALLDDVFQPHLTQRIAQAYYEAIGSTRLVVLQCGGKNQEPLLLMMDLEPPLELPARSRLERLAEFRLTLTKLLLGEAR